VLQDMTYLCISASDSSSQNLLQHFKECIKFIHECRLGGGGRPREGLHCQDPWGLAGVSRSTTILVAYLMTVTELSWESCLAATKAVRSYVSPNFGFQQQLQEYEVTLLQEVR
ncbi:Dual specificity protein phosphatase 22-A, partial [Cariama cristata]